jgi:hypothetical protein
MTPTHRGSARPTGTTTARAVTPKSVARSNTTGSPLQPPPTRADRLNGVLIQLGFDPSEDWGEEAPYSVDSVGDRTIIQINMPDRRVHVGVGADLDAAIGDLETQLMSGDK